MLSVQQFLTQNRTTHPVPHPPYSPNLTLSDFFVCLFPRMQKVLKGKHFAGIEEVKLQTAEALKGIKINELKNVLGSGKTS